jgi:hypothetical protein
MRQAHTGSVVFEVRSSPVVLNGRVLAVFFSQGPFSGIAWFHPRLPGISWHLIRCTGNRDKEQLHDSNPSRYPNDNLPWAPCRYRRRVTDRFSRRKTETPLGLDAGKGQTDEFPARTCLFFNRYRGTGVVPLPVFSGMNGQATSRSACIPLKNPVR